MRSRVHPALIVWLSLPLWLCFSSPEGAGGSAFKGIVGQAINFVILFGGLIYLLRKPMKSFLERKSTEIALSLQDAEEAKLTAQKKKTETEDRVARLDDEVGRIIKQAEETGRRESSRIREMTDREIERVKRLAEQEIEVQLRAAVHDLKEYTAELATLLAEERLKIDLTLPDQARLIDRSIGQLAGLYEKSTSS